MASGQSRPPHAMPSLTRPNQTTPNRSEIAKRGALMRWEPKGGTQEGAKK